jgi:hypothetical protein
MPMSATSGSPPILLLIFNRPKQLRAVMKVLKQQKPQKVYISADGPRNSFEAELCEQARKTALEIDWPCTVETLFRDQNHGCRVAVSTGLDWFFSQEEQGIILEDDCVPSASFFPYCAELLERYKHDTRVMCVSGDNFQPGSVTRYSYYFSRYMHCWGWATWRRAWALYDRDMALWPEFKAMGGLEAWSNGSPEFVESWTKIFDDCYMNKIDSWAYRYLFSCWLNNGLTCLPAENLVSNIGFGEDATHTKSSSQVENKGAGELQFPLRHPPFYTRNVDADKFEDLACFGIRKKTTFELFHQRLKSSRRKIRAHLGLKKRAHRAAEKAQ